MTVTVRKDLRPRFGPARDQGVRPTCLGFATSDLHAAIRTAPPIPFSVEYLFYMAVQRTTSQSPDKGVSVKEIQEALEHDGQPLEADWPYLPALPNDLSAWKPPGGMTVFKRKMQTANADIADITTRLNHDNASLLAVRVSTAFYCPDALGVVNPPTNDPDTGNHALIAVGHGTLCSNPVLLVRNSWGRDWGIDGHAWVPRDYIADRLLSCSTIP